jgi:hypothetical protein
MAATELLVRVEKVIVLDRRGGGEWRFGASVKRLPSNKTESFGDPNKEFEARRNDVIKLDAWKLPFKIDPDDKKIEITLSGADSAGFSVRDLGKVVVTLNTPILHGYDLSLQSSKGLFQAKIFVTVTKDTGMKPGEITTIASYQRGKTYNTVHDGMQRRLVHIHPVIPVPWATGIPQSPMGVRFLSGSDPEKLHIEAGAKKLNALVNPALIPVIGPSHPAFVNLCARIHVTHYRPKNLDLTKLVWKAATDNIRFFDGGGGKTEVKGVASREVKAYGVLKGVNDEMGMIEVRWDEPGQPLLAVYRAWVGRPKYLHYRANIIMCKNADEVNIKNPTVMPAQVQKQMDFNAVLMWQSGIRLFPDPDETPYQNAKKKGKAIYEVELDANQTYNMNPSASDANYYPTILNQRAGVLNISYIRSHSGGDPSGLARDRMLSAASKTESLSGNPSTSWVFPTGVYPDAAGKTIKMETMGPSTQRADTQKGVGGDRNLDKVCGLTISNWAAVIDDANTVAHEAGHVLGLHHRGSGGYDAAAGMKPSRDKVNHLAGSNAGNGHPWDENIMSYSGYDRAQDFDLIQTKTLRRHGLMKNAPLKGKPPPPPPGKKPVPRAWLPTKDDVTLLQEYLKGKRPGLKHSGYDLGSSGPKGDGIDGILTPKTKEAIKSFQRAHGGLGVDGKYGSKTAAAFNKEING